MVLLTFYWVRTCRVRILLKIVVSLDQWFSKRGADPHISDDAEGESTKVCVTQEFKSYDSDLTHWVFLALNSFLWLWLELHSKFFVFFLTQRFVACRYLLYTFKTKLWTNNVTRTKNLVLLRSSVDSEVLVEVDMRSDLRSDHSWVVVSAGSKPEQLCERVRGWLLVSSLKSDCLLFPFTDTHTHTL